MKNIFLSGSTGKMGKEIIRILSEDNDFQFKRGVSKEGVVTSGLDGIDLIIDFSNANFFQNILDIAVSSQIPFVSGTTGLGDTDFQKLTEAAKVIPVLWAPNMSVGIHMMSEMFKVFKQPEDFDFQIEEIHHKHKVDSPSGTAKFLQKQLEDNNINTTQPPLALRGGGVFGVHQLFAFSEEETISIKHEALNRSVFAKGAVKASKWLIKQPKGLYEFKNILGYTQ
jgi:4-hydroxy-tetrahydrodipicolinate reductase